MKVANASEHMLAVIAAGAFRLRDAIGKNALDERVMTAMGKVPRHEFVPIELSAGSSARPGRIPI